MTYLAQELLTKEAFAPYGSVLETKDAQQIAINQGTTIRFDGLAVADPGPDGDAQISIFRGQPRKQPIVIEMLERHPLASQAFFPLSLEDWLIVVADRADLNALRCFRAAGDQGVQYAPGVWHHPLLVLAQQQDFLVIDRKGPGENLQEAVLPQGVFIDLAPPSVDDDDR